MQGEMGGMAGSWYTENRVVERGGRETAASGEAYANAMENDCAHRGTNSYAVLGKVSEAFG